MGTLRYEFERRLADTSASSPLNRWEFRRPRRGEGGVVVSIADPRAMFTLVDNAAVSTVAAEADQRLRRVIGAVGGKEAV